MRPGEDSTPLQGRSLWEASSPVGLSESPTRPGKNQAAGRRKRRRPRQRPCLLKGCEKKFRPRHARQRYCSDGCREEARKWARWKEQQRYRGTAAGKKRRNDQNRRYRERIKRRKPSEPETVAEAARVVPRKYFFRANVRPAGMLRAVCGRAAKSAAALLLQVVPAGAGAGPGTGGALEAGAHLIQTY